MISLLVKTTDRCNARCLYCNSIARDEKGVDIGFPVLERLLGRIEEHLRTTGEGTLEILWHGGEPLVKGPKWFLALAELQATACPVGGKRIRHSMQTNLTLLTPGHLRAFAALGLYGLSTSFDPHSGVRGIGKRNDSRRYQKQFLRGLSLLEATDIPWTLVHVVTRRSAQDPRGLINVLCNLGPRGGVSLVPTIGERHPGAVLAPKEYADFLGAAFEYWWPRRKAFAQVSPFSQLVDAVAEGTVRAGCLELGVCEPRRDQIGVDMHGNLWGRSGVMKEWDHPLGHLDDTSLCEAVSAGRTLLAGQAAACGACRLAAMCHATDDETGQEPFAIGASAWCEARREFIENYLTPIVGAGYGG